MSKTKTFTLYLVKENLKDQKDILTDTGRERIASESTIELNSKNRLGDEAISFVFQNPPIEPSWIADLKVVFDDVPQIKNKTSSALVVFRTSERIFISTFGSGWQYINDSSVVSDFGLKVTINSLEDGKVKRVDRSNLGEALKGVTQSAFQRDIQSFDLDEALDQIKRITGRLEKSEFASNLSGATALKVSREMTMNELGEIADEALKLYNSNAYKSTSFSIIDKIRPIIDRDQIAKLDEEAVALIKSGTEQFELSMPGWSEDDVVYYGLKGPGSRKRFPNLLLSHYIEAVQKQLNDLETHTILNDHRVFAEFNSDIAATKTWSIKKALVGSINFDGGIFAISEGNWFRLDEQFKNDVDLILPSITEAWETKPEVIRKVISDDNKEGLETELSYNLRCAEKYNQICLDQKIITVPSVSFGKFEACDLLDIENKRLIHVKKGSGRSSVLSHFFKQGSNSAQTLKTVPESQVELVKKVEEVSGLKDAALLKRQIQNGFKEWSVEFHIIDAPGKNGSFGIPFFSKITLRDEVRMLRGMEFKVALRFIPVAV